MQAEAATPQRARRGLTRTERNWLAAAGILAGSVALFAAICALEIDAGRWNPDIRLVFYPAETATRFLGISHFLVALLFTVTSKRMRTVGAWGWFAALLALGALFCSGYSGLRAFSPLAASAIFTTYFLVHDFRDQVFFYFANGDAPPSPDRVALGRTLVWTPWLFVAVLLAAACAAAALGILPTARFDKALATLTLPLKATLGLLPAAGAAAGAVILAQRWKREGLASAAAVLRAHRPIFFVFAGTFLILFAGLFAGLQAYSIVILHVAAWYVFSIRQIKARPAPAVPAGSWAWLRGTLAGFNLLHVGSAVLLVALGAVWAYAWRNDPGHRPLWIVLHRDNFQLWTILHVTVSLPSK